MQDYITRTRLAGEPPHVMLVPRLREIGLMEFDRAVEAIAEGRDCVEQALPMLAPLSIIRSYRVNEPPFSLRVRTDRQAGTLPLRRRKRGAFRLCSFSTVTPLTLILTGAALRCIIRVNTLRLT